LDALEPPAQLALLRRNAGRPDAHAKLLYGVALQRLGRPVSAERLFAQAARLAPRDPEAQAAAAVGRYRKGAPERAFSRLGPLTRRFPHAATIRFHLGLCLLWLGNLQEAKRQLLLARKAAGGSSIGREANRLLARLESVRTPS
jgi:Flp pilus assembly protein TadD